MLALALALACCGDDDDDGPPVDAGVDATPDLDAPIDAPIEPCLPAHVDDDPDPAPEACPGDLAAGATDLLEAARATAGLAGALAWTDEDWLQADYLQVLPNAYILPGYAATHDSPETSVCFANEVSRRLDRALASRHALSRTIAEAAGRLGVALEVDAEPTVDERICGSPLATAALEFARAVGGTPNEAAVIADAADVPLSLQAAVASILAGMQRVAAARAEAVRAFGQLDAEDVAVNAPDLTGISSLPAAAWITSWVVQDELQGPWRTALLQAARDLAVEIDHARPILEAGGFGEGFGFSLDTPAGRLIVRDDAADTYDAGLDPVALLVDTGGDDVYLCAAGANVSEPRELLTIPVAVLIDAGGADRYGYDEFDTQYDGVGHRLPADGWGRVDAGEGPYCVPGEGGVQYYGPITLSRDMRQGVGVFGVGLLVDLGGGDDTYASLRRSQGYGAAGVGVLFDDGGNDRYAVESEGQGAATMGLGLLLDGGGDDVHVAYQQSQGFGYVGGVGALVDADGVDEYVCDSGIPDEGGDPIYCSPQRQGNGNSSFCQGAGFGLRGDTRDPPTFLAGGLGILRDAGGRDTYEASVFAQGTGYWQGIGLLSDGGGDDAYDAIWYVQGAAAHYAVGMLIDGGGDDAYDDREWTVGVALGSGHDFSLGALVDEGGDDRYFGRGNGLGDANCCGIGILVDNGGADAYRSTTAQSLGHAHLSGECLRREGALSGAVFIDAAGDDSYDRPPTDPLADDDQMFPANSGYAGEHGAFVDASEGDSRIHVQH